MIRHGPALLGALLLAGLPEAALAAERVDLRASPHDSFLRLVFDWPTPVGYQAMIEGGTLVVVFNRELETSFAPLRDNLVEEVADAELGSDGKTVRVTLRTPHELRHFALDNSIVVDLVKPEVAAAAVETAPTIGVRVGEHPTFSRVVFDWTRHVDYEVDGDAPLVTVRFSRPAALDLTAIERNPPSRVVGASTTGSADGPAAVTLAVREGTRIRHFRDGLKVVLDVLRSSEITDRPSGADVAEAATGSLPVPKAAPRVPVETRPTTTSGAPAAPDAASPFASTETRDESNPRHDAPSATRAPTSLAGVAEGQAAGPENETAPTSEHAKATAAAVQPQATATTPVAAAPEIAVSFSARGGGGVLRFPFLAPTAAAAFRRGGHLWLVFDEPRRVDVRALAADLQDVALAVDQQPHPEALVLRLETIPGFNPTLTLDGLAWQVALRPQPLEPTEALAVLPSTDIHGNDTVTVVSTSADSRMVLRDPEVGDQIAVMPLSTPGAGVDKGGSAVDFTLLESAQGVALVPIRERLQLRTDGGAVTIGAIGGLSVTPSEERVKIEDARVGTNLVPRFFEFSEWRHEEAGDYATAKHALQRQIWTTAGAERNRARLDLARFFFAHSQPERALGVMAAVSREGDTLAGDAEYKALRGAASFLLGREDVAFDDLNDRRLDEEPEVALWRAALAANRGDLSLAASGLRDGELYVQRYPGALRARFSLMGADVALRAGDPTGAQAWLESLEGVPLRQGDAGQAKVLRGKLSAAFGKEEEALEQFDVAIASDDRRSRAMAVLERTELLLASGELDDASALEDLDRLRFAWRGDDLEFDVLRRLGTLQIDSGDYRGGLQTLKRAAANFPQQASVATLTELMQKTFGDLYLHGGADTLPAVSAIALFNEFRELTPTGPEGDEMIRELADRLVSVDLLEQAAGLLTHQMDFRVEGEEKAQVGTRLAILQLMDRRPEAAVTALRDSEAGPIPKPLARERRLLEARALSELGEVEAALEKIADDTSVVADRLRAEILWRIQDWARVSQVLERLTGPAPTAEEALDEDRSRFVLNRAVALSLAGKRDELTALRQDFGSAMEQTDFAYDFRIIASEESSPRDFNSALARVASVDDFQAFMENYRARLARPVDGGLVN